MPEQFPDTGFRQLRLIQLADIDTYTFIDPLERWEFADVFALAFDPEDHVRRLAALSNWNWDIRLQRVLAVDPDESVVLNLLSRIDPPAEIANTILTGPHLEARRLLAARPLSSDTLRRLVDDEDECVRCAARRTLGSRGVLPVAVRNASAQ